MKPNITNNKFIPAIPYIAIFIAFVIYMRYWSKVVNQCPSFCGRGYDDSAYYQDFLGLLHGSWPGDVVFFQSPVPGFFLGVTYIIFKYPVDNMAIPYLIQIFLVTLTGALAYKLADKMFSRSVGIITILLLGWYVFVRFYATTIEANTLTAFFITVLLYFLLKYQDSKNKLYLIIASIFLGLAVLGRSNNLAIIGAVVLWFIVLRISLRNLIIDISILLLTTLIVLLPAIIHSSLAAGKLIFVTHTGVYNFTMGNLPGAPGYYTPNATHSLEPALRFMIEQPIDWLLLTLRKFQLFFTFPWSLAPLDELPVSIAVAWIITIGFYFFYFLTTFSRRRSLLHFSLIFYAGSIIITHVEDEYRTPILPILFIFAAVTMVNLAKLLYKLTSKVRANIIKWHAHKPAIGLIGSSLIMFAFILRIPSPQLSYKVDFVESDPVHSGIIVGQNFQVDCPNLNQISVKMFSATPDNFITFNLKENSIDGPEIYSQQIDTTQLTSLDYHRITFPEIRNSAGQDYFFYFDTADLKTAEEGIIFAGGRHPFAESLNRIEATPRYVGGAYVNSEELDANLAFSAYCNASQLDLIATAIDNMADGTPNPQITRLLLNIILIVSILTFIVSVILIIYKGITYVV